MAKKIITLGAALAVVYPLWVHIGDVPWGEISLLAALFPAFGLLAFTLLWLHSISGVFEDYLRTIYDFDFFVHWSSLAIFVSMILHVLLLLIWLKFDVVAIYEINPQAITLGIVGLVLLLTYDIGKALRKREFFSRHWNKILIISTIGFLLTFFHSIMLGSDLQSGFLRYLWIFYGITAILATIYTYGVKRFLSN